MRKELYQKRVNAGQCVTCCTLLCKNATRRKCDKCRLEDNKYRKDNRSKEVVEAERKYRQRVWFKRCVWKSSRKDRLKNRTSEDNIVKPTRLRTLRILQNNKCFYCEKSMQVENRRKSDGLTIERLNNAEPHTVKNCVLACSSCNCKKLSNKHNIDIAAAFDLILERFEKSKLYPKFLEILTDESLQNSCETSDKSPLPA